MTPRADRPAPRLHGGIPIELHPLVAKMDAALGTDHLFGGGTWIWYMHPRQVFAYRGMLMVAEAPVGRRGRSQRREGRRLQRKAYVPTGWTRKKRLARAFLKKNPDVKVKIS